MSDEPQDIDDSFGAGGAPEAAPGVDEIRAAEDVPGEGEVPDDTPEPAAPEATATPRTDEIPDAEDVPGGGEVSDDAEGPVAPEGKAAPSPAKTIAPAQPVPPARLRVTYETDIRERLQEEFSYTSRMQHPRITKVTLSMGVGDAKTNAKFLDDAVEQLGVIAGQRPHITRARTSIAQFKLREGMAIGCRVTLRGQRMWEFLDRLLSIALPRIRDFRGVNPDSFDGRGNYNLGLREQTIFPEIDYDRIDQARGLNVTITTTARTDEEARSLLRHLGMPFSAEGYSAEERAARRRRKMRKYSRGKGRGRR